MTIKKQVPVAVIVVSFNTRDLTRNALNALYASTVSPTQVVVVDNDSKDGSVEMVRAEFPDVQVIANRNNVGFAKANNQAIRTIVTQPFVWLLNSDTETGKQSLGELYGHMVANPAIGALGPQLVYKTRELQSVGGYFPNWSNVLLYLIPITFILPKTWRQKMKSIALFPQPIPKEGLILDYVTGAALMLRKSALDTVGLLSEDYFMYFEETDLCLRLNKAGFGVKVIDTEPVMHVYGGSFKTRYDSRRLKIFLNSLEIFVRNNYTGFTKWVLIAEIKILKPFNIFFKRVLKSWI